MDSDRETDVRMDGWMDGRMHACMYAWLYAWISSRLTTVFFALFVSGSKCSQAGVLLAAFGGDGPACSRRCCCYQECYKYTAPSSVLLRDVPHRKLAILQYICYHQYRVLHYGIA